MDIYDDDFDYTDYTDEDDYDNDDFDFHHGNVDDLYDDVGDDYGYDAWGIQSDGEDETPFTIPIPADLAEFYPERKSCVKSFLELYVLCGKILKMIRLIDDYYLYWALIWYWDHLKNFITEIPQGPLGMSIGTIWVTQKRFQGPPARGF